MGGFVTVEGSPDDGGTRPWFCVATLSAAVVTLLSVTPAYAEVHCPVPEILEPAADATLTGSRPILRWSSVPEATGYRVRLFSRVPEGAVILSLDTLASTPEFQPPAPLTERNAIVRVSLAARCKDGESPEATLRFFVDTRLDCPAVTGLTVVPAPLPRLQWRAAERAGRYQVVVYRAEDGRLLGHGETQAPAYDLPASQSSVQVAGVRPRCREGFGPFTFAAY
ncbi:MAG: hypothetical protein KDI49_09030 [Gammaproteobacteria bacterium]|nr:hypothetical protein [Gammaproteobacteria bacterium]